MFYSAPPSKYDNSVSKNDTTAPYDIVSTSFVTDQPMYIH